MYGKKGYSCLPQWFSVPEKVGGRGCQCRGLMHPFEAVNFVSEAKRMEVMWFHEKNGVVHE